jgi:hypothetical protein
MNRIRTLFYRCRSNPNLSSERSGASLTAGKPPSGEPESFSRLVEVQFQQRSIGNSVTRMIASNRRADIGELGAFMSLGVASCAAILLAIFANLEFPRVMDQVAKRLSAPTEALGMEAAVIGSNVARTNRPATGVETITNGGFELPTEASPKPTADTGIHASPSPRPSV